MIDLSIHPVSNIINQSNNHFYISPHPLLKTYIAHYTISFPSKSIFPGILTLIPDASGCVVLTFDSNDLHSYFWGPTTKTVYVKRDEMDVPVRIFVEFLPGGAYHLTGINQTELTDSKVPLEDINFVLARNINILFESSKNFKEFLDGLDFLFLSCASKVEACPLITSIVPSLKEHSGTLSVKSVTNMTFYSERHLNRVFNQVLGMSVKKYSQLLRINHVLININEKDTTLTSIAQNSGYYDQSHFIHDFKAVCGVSPTQYTQQMSGFYNEAFKF